MVITFLSYLMTLLPLFYHINKFNAHNTFTTLSLRLTLIDSNNVTTARNI